MENDWNTASKVEAGTADYERMPLELSWFLDWDSIADNYHSSDITANELFEQWLATVPETGDELPIRWMVANISESVPEERSSGAGLQPRWQNDKGREVTEEHQEP